MTLLQEGVNHATKALNAVRDGRCAGRQYRSQYNPVFTSTALRQGTQEALNYWRSHPHGDYWRGWLIGLSV